MLNRIITLSILLIYSISSGAQIDSSDVAIGKVISLKSNILSEERFLTIYLPNEYNQSDTSRYHVIYLLDGSAVEDFVHVAGLVQYNTFSWIQQLPPTIIVGINNTDRKRDFTFPSTISSEKKLYPTTGKSKNFIAFIENELQPYIESHFRTNGSNTLIGQSLGGLLATEILFSKPTLFNKYIIISPSIWWDNGSILLMKPNFSKINAHKISIYLAVGNEGLTPSENPRVMTTDVHLLAEKITLLNNPGISLKFQYLPDEDHATIGHIAIYNAFKILFKRPRINY